jgi:hypothetical protein
MGRSNEDSNWKKCLPDPAAESTIHWNRWRKWLEQVSETWNVVSWSVCWDNMQKALHMWEMLMIIKLKTQGSSQNPATLPFFEQRQTYFQKLFLLTTISRAVIAQSVSLPGYGLDDRGSRVRFPARAGNFSLHHRVQNGSGAHPASYRMTTKGSFPGGKAAWAWSWPLSI